MLQSSTKCFLLFLASLLIFATNAPAKKGQHENSKDAESSATLYPDDLLQALEWREVGPYRGGRSAAVAGLPDQPNVYYFGATGGGVWKTEDGGKTWQNISDGFFGGSIGAVAVSEWDPNVVYVGGGEKTVRGNVSHGDGMWKSTDGGKTWASIGLENSHHIPRIRVHPKNPNIVWAAVLGHLYESHSERGVYKSLDGGTTWKKILFVNEDSGAADLALDPTNPRILYATFWRVRRTPWSLESGGEGSGLWKSTDGGETWTDISRRPGLPRGTLGISGITVSPSQPDNLYAIIEAEDGGVFRSTDGGESWTRTNEERKLRQRAWYYTRIYADPADADAVYVTNVRFHHSKDGGKTFEQIPTPHGDNHDLWIAPDDPLRMVEANDGGANVSFDGGKTWTPQNNQPTAQFYRVSTDNAFPYRLLAGQQDNSAVRVRSRSAQRGSIGTRDWEPTAGGESGHIVAKPDDPDIVFGGSYGGLLQWTNHRTGETRIVNVWPDDPMGWGAAELKYRFQWNFPIFFSPHDPNTIYAAGNLLFKSQDAGHTWQAISPDLTRDDKSKQGPSGGPITKDNTSVEYYSTIFAAAESPHEPGVLWAGSDDGLIHLSRDGGSHWENVTPPKMPEWTQVNGIDVHPFEKGGLYVAGTRYKLGDFKPYLYKTVDYGKSWTAIHKGIDPLHFTRAIRADPDRQGLLYAGTERGVYVSFDDGGNWRPLQLNLPIVPITDLAVKEKDLVASTQGRGFWILDDLTLLHEVRPEVHDQPAHFFKPRPAYRLPGGRDEDPGHAGTNPPSGVVLRYFLSEDVGPDSELKLELLDADHQLIRAFSREPGPDDPKSDSTEKRLDEPDLRQLPAKAGTNSFVWDLNYPEMKTFDGLVLWSGFRSPKAAPGQYHARLTVGDWSAEVPFEILPDPRSRATDEDLRAQFAFQLSIRDKVTEIHKEIERLRQIRRQVDSLLQDLGEASPDITEKAQAILAEMEAAEQALYQTQNQSRQDPLNFPIRLNDKLASLGRLARVGDFRPTEAMIQVRDQLSAAVDEELKRLRVLWSDDLPVLNALVREQSVNAIRLPAETDPATD